LSEANKWRIKNVYIADNDSKGEKMTAELSPTEQEHEKPKVMHQGGGSNSVYGIGLIGAWVYYLRRATTFREGLLGFLKGLVWPAMLVYELLKFLNKE
jgi:hypothetical protein